MYHITGADPENFQGKRGRDGVCELGCNSSLLYPFAEKKEGDAKMTLNVKSYSTVESGCNPSRFDTVCCLP